MSARDDSGRTRPSRDRSEAPATQRREARESARTSPTTDTPSEEELGPKVSQTPELLTRFLNWAKRVTRVQFLEGAFGLAFAVVAGRLAVLQTAQSGKYASMAWEERTARMTLPAKRGAIYDRNGTVLAQSVDATTIYAIPANVATENINATANVLAEYLGGAAIDYAEKLTGSSTFCYISKKVDPDVADQLKAELTNRNLGGIYYLDDSKRVYPLGTVAGNLVGCVGGDNGEGLSGLELYYNDILTGTDGYLVQERSRSGSPIAGGQNERVDPEDGENIILSIDVDIQRVAEETLLSIIEEWNCGDAVAVVMQPETGEILAATSTPLLDPGNFSQAEAAAFNLRAVTDSYEPGSTTKPITASMAIDLGIATPDTTYGAPAKIEVGDDTVGDADGRTYYMDMSLTNMLERSSNVGAVLCAESVGATQFSEYFGKYHIGTKTGVDYPGESAGIVPSLEEYTGAWEAMAFGQSFAVPPMQMVRAIGAIANEGILIQPHFLVSKGGEEVDWGSGERVIATATAEQVAWMMNSVVVNGYGYTGAIDGYNLSAKTGTSERLDPNTGTYATNSFTVSFMGYGPTEDPKALVYVIFDEVDMAHEGTSAGAPWATIMREALTKLGVSPSW